MLKYAAQYVYLLFSSVNNLISANISKYFKNNVITRQAILHKETENEIKLKLIRPVAQVHIH